MIERVERFTQKDGLRILKVFLKSNKIVPTGDFFYCEEKHEGFLARKSWFLHSSDRPSIVRGTTCGVSKPFYLHQEIVRQEVGDPTVHADHRNCVKFDDVYEQNLYVATKSEIIHNRRSTGYRLARNAFYPTVACVSETYVLHCLHSEVEALKAQVALEKECYTGYMYNFLEDRRSDMDLLIKVREGVLTQEDATYLYLQRYARNPWFYFRYDLQETFDYYNLPEPEEGVDFLEDSEGFMTDLNGVHLIPENWLMNKSYSF